MKRGAKIIGLLLALDILLTIGGGVVGLHLGRSLDQQPQRDAEVVANCIAEYAYTHPGVHKQSIDNLAAALEECR